MSQVKLQAARELFQERHFDAARILLDTIKDDPIAQDLLQSLDKIVPEVKPFDKMSATELVDSINNWDAVKELIYRGFDNHNSKEISACLIEALSNDNTLENAAYILGILDDSKSVPALLEIRKRDPQFFKNWSSDNKLVNAANNALYRMNNLQAEIGRVNPTVQVRVVYARDDQNLRTEMPDAVVHVFVSADNLDLFFITLRHNKDLGVRGFFFEWRETKISARNDTEILLAWKKAI